MVPLASRILARISRSDYLLALAIGLVYYLVALGQEKILNHEGLGDDGVYYGGWVADFPNVFFGRALDGYYIQRTLPSAITYLIFKAFSIQPTTPHIISAFEWFNVTMVALGGLAWAKVSRLLEIGDRGRILGAYAIFANYCVLKMLPWDPVLGDLWGYDLGLVLVWAYLARQPIISFVVTLLGAFVWPTILPVGALLLLLNKTKTDERRPAPLHLGVVVSGALALAWTYYCVRTVAEHFQPGFGYEPPEPSLRRLGVVCVLFYGFFAMRALIDARELFSPLVYLRSVLTPAGVSGVAAIAIARWIQHRYASTKPGFELSDAMHFNAFLGTTKPLVFLVAHVAYFGPIVVFMVLRWRRVCEAFRRGGLGILGVAFLGVIFSFDSESRHLLTFAGVLFPFVIKELDESLDDRSAAVFAVAAVVVSKVWIVFEGNVVPQMESAQSVFMTPGPWMWTRFYLLQGLIVLGFGWWLSRAMKRTATA